MKKTGFSFNKALNKKWKQDNTLIKKYSKYLGTLSGSLSQQKTPQKEQKKIVYKNNTHKKKQHGN